MTLFPVKLENFEEEPLPEPEDLTAAAESAAYDRGYAAGWEDAVAAELAERLRLRTDLDARLQDLALTWQEARALALNAIEPLVMAVATKLLPRLAMETMGDLLRERILAFAGEATASPVLLSVAPDDRAAITERLSSHPELPFRLVEDVTLLPGQCLLRRGESETLIDLTETTETLRRVLRDQFHDRQEIRANG